MPDLTTAVTSQHADILHFSAHNLFSRPALASIAAHIDRIQALPLVCHHSKLKSTAGNDHHEYRVHTSTCVSRSLQSLQKAMCLCIHVVLMWIERQTENCM